MNEDIDNIIEKSTFKNIRKMVTVDLNNMPVNVWNGVYIITIDSGHRYIGSSRNIFIEIKQTIYRFRTNVKIKNVCTYRFRTVKIKNVGIYVCIDELQARNLERFLIGEINPELNCKYRTDGSITKAVNISEDIYALITRKRENIYEKYDRRYDIKDITDAAIIAGIEKVEEELGLDKMRDKINKIQKELGSNKIEDRPDIFFKQENGSRPK